MRAEPGTSESATAPKTPDRCPGCQGGPLFAVGGDGPNFLCRSCNRCWHMGEQVELVNPLTCRGCEWRHECISRFDCVLQPGGQWPHLDVTTKGSGARPPGAT